jgi:hypothetical protein
MTEVGVRDDRELRTAWNSPAAAFAVMALGIALRVFAMIRFPFEQDELYTLAESRDLFHTALAPGIDSRPLYYLLQHPLLSVLPTTAVALRVLPLIFGALGLYVTWLAARRYFGPTPGIVAVVLLALSPWHLYASSMARYYSLVYLCAALVVLWLPDAYDSDVPRRYLAVLGAFLVGTWTHPSFVLAMVGLVVGLSLVQRDSRPGFRWPSANGWRYLWGPYALALVLEFVLLRNVGRGGAMANLGSRGIAATIRLIPAMIDWMTLPVFIAAVAGALILVLRPSRRRIVGAMTVGAGLSTCLLLLIASMRTGVYADYGIGMLPLLVLCVAALTERFDPGVGRMTGTLIVLALVVGAGAPSIVSFLSDGLRFDYRPAYNQIAAQDAGATVLGWPEILRKYYAKDLHGYELKSDSVYLNRILDRDKDVWAVVSTKRYGIVEDDSGQLQDWLKRRCQIENSFTHPRFDYRVYRVDLYRCRDERVSASSLAQPATLKQTSAVK